MRPLHDGPFLPDAHVGIQYPNRFGRLCHVHVGEGGCRRLFQPNEHNVQIFIPQDHLGFPLLADEDHAVADAYGAWGEKSMYGKKYEGIIRSSFLIDENGRILGAWYGVKPEDTVPNAMGLLKK